MMRKFFNKKNICLAALPLVAACASVPAHVAFAASQQIILEVSHSTIYRVGSANIIRIAIANPAIADVAVIDNHNINIIGKESGSTTLMVWSSDGMRQDFTITVSPVDRGSAEAIKASMKLPDVEVELVGTGKERKILLTGFVENQIEMELAENVAALYVDGEWKEIEAFKADSSDASNGVDGKIRYSKRVHSKIINNIQIRNPLQVNLAAMVLDITDGDGYEFGVDYSNPSDLEYYTPARFDPTTGQVTSGAKAGRVEDGTAWVFRGGMSWHKATGRLMADVNAAIHAMVSENKGKVLSRPNVTTMSGKEAEIKIGGEIPFTTTSKDGQTNVTFKPYGIMLHIKPEVDSEGKIYTDIKATVSDIDPNHTVMSNGNLMYALTSSDVSTSVTIANGQTMVIGGLMNNIDTKIIKKFPILGDIPIIGELFKSTSKDKKKHELVIMLTPTIVDNSSVGKVKVGNKLKEMMEESKRELAQRREMDMNAPQPSGEVRTKQ